MPRFFFDVNDGSLTLDDVGHEMVGIETAIRRANEGLPSIAAHEKIGASERGHFAITVRGEDGRAVYTATMTFTGVRLPL